MQENLGHEPPNLPLLYLGAGHFQRLGKGAGLVTVKDMLPAEFVDPLGTKTKVSRIKQISITAARMIAASISNSSVQFT